MANRLFRAKHFPVNMRRRMGKRTAIFSVNDVLDGVQGCPDKDVEMTLTGVHCNL